MQSLGRAAEVWWLRRRWWLRMRSSVDRNGGRNHTGDLRNEPRYRRFSEGALYGEQPERRGEARFVTASVVDPFGIILGVMYNPHYLEVLGSIREA
jgi:hypothetical protein